MKYQIGDDIIVLHSHEEGKVIDILNDKMVMIEVRGVKFPAYMDQIDFPYFYRFTKQKTKTETEPKKEKVKVYIDNIPKEKPTPNQHKTEDGVWLCVIPKFSFDEFNDEYVTELKIFLINKTEAVYNFNYKQFLKDDLNFELKSTVQGFHDFYLHDLPFECVNDNPNFEFQFSLVIPQKNKAEYFEAGIKLKPKQIFKQIEALKANNQPTITYNLFQQYPNALTQEKLDTSKLLQKGFKVYDASKIKQHLQPARTVVDLHIEKLIDNWESKPNFEILTIQLAEFEKWYEAAVAHRLQNLIIIHGIGKGKLKDEIHSILKSKKEVNYFINQYDPRFGYGATEIFFK